MEDLGETIRKIKEARQEVDRLEASIKQVKIKKAEQKEIDKKKAALKSTIERVEKYHAYWNKAVGLSVGFWATTLAALWLPVVLGAGLIKYGQIVYDIIFLHDYKEQLEKLEEGS